MFNVNEGVNLNVAVNVKFSDEVDVEDNVKVGCLSEHPVIFTAARTRHSTG